MLITETTMPLLLSGPADLPFRRSQGFARHLGGIGLRSRLLLLVGVTAIPALAVLAYHEWGESALASVLAPEWHAAISLTGGLLLLGGALMSIGFGIVVGEHVVRRPTETLLDATERWTAGDLGVRIDVGDADGTEFGRIGAAFNRLAETVGRRHDELRALNAELEARVAERTRAYSEANARLVAEMAERERAEARLRQAHKLQAVGALAGRFAHDFNNVLTTIVAALDVLRGRMGPGQDSSLRLIDNALTASERGNKLSCQLLSFSGRQRLTPVPTDLNATIAALIELLAATLETGITIETAFAEDLWLAQVDPSQAEAAILNLAVNARDAMPDGGVLRFTTRNAAGSGKEGSEQGDYVAIEVTDTGIGMTDEIARLAFEPFFTTKTAVKASGLGLSQVHGLASQSRGEVSIDSAPDRGTTVTLLLPRAVGARRAATAPSHLPSAVIPAAGSETEASAEGQSRTRLHVIQGGIADDA